MKKNTIIIICAIFGIILAAIGLISTFSSNKSQDENYKFNVKEANYIERYYQRYLAYRNKHKDYSDDKIVTYVNMGLDYDFYSNVENTNESDGILKITNKHYALSKDFSPQLETLSEYGIQIDKEAANSLKEMIEKAKEPDYDVQLKPIYSYIDYDFQGDIYQTYAKKLGESKVDSYYAKQGYSDYQTGLAVAFGPVNEDFQYMVDYAWLSEFAYEYGFILRYPEGKEDITGFSFDPCHYRYVGKDAAKVIHDKNITFEEYYATYVLK